MSLMNMESYECARCGETNEVEIWDSINVTLDPEVKDRILDRSAFTTQCTKCGRTGELVYPCLYHDMDLKLMVWVVPGNDPAPDHKAEMDSMRPKFARLMRESEAGYRLRAVRSWSELIEKIIIFDSRMDDRVVEICKLYLMKGIIASRPECHDWPMYFHFEDDMSSAILVDHDKGVTERYMFSQEAYTKLCRKHTLLIPVVEPETYAFVDRNWLQETFLKNVSDQKRIAALELDCVPFKRALRLP